VAYICVILKILFYTSVCIPVVTTGFLLQWKDLHALVGVEELSIRASVPGITTFTNKIEGKRSD
jgi:hypothetical protein